jgi:hypothetical protein
MQTLSIVTMTAGNGCCTNEEVGTVSFRRVEAVLVLEFLALVLLALSYVTDGGVCETSVNM